MRARWPKAEIDGIDSSPEMLQQARASGVEARFIEADMAQRTPEAPYDVIYSNGALQWLRGHETLFPRLFSFVAPGGALAVQVPRNYDDISQRLVREAVADPRWAGQLQNVRDWWNGLAPESYYDLLAPGAWSIDIWETRYFHALESEEAFSLDDGYELAPLRRRAGKPHGRGIPAALPAGLGGRLCVALGRQNHPPLGPARRWITWL